MAGANLRVGMVGKLLVHYKLGKPDAVRVANSCNGIKTIEKYLRRQGRAVLSGAVGSGDFHGKAVKGFHKIIF